MTDQEKTLKTLLAEAKTLENAIEWNEEPDKFVFCIVLLDLSAWEQRADGYVDRLENWYVKILKENNVELLDI